VTVGFTFIPPASVLEGGRNYYY